MNYIHRETREIISHRQLCRANNASIAMGRDFGQWQPLSAAPMPEIPEGKTVEVGPVVEIEGRLYQSWEVVDAVQVAE